MHILLLTASLPYPPQQGGAIRTYGLMHGLKRAGHRLSLMSFHDQATSAERTPLHDLCESIETVPTPTRSRLDRLRGLLFTSQADIAHRLYSPAFWEALQRRLAQTPIDLVQAEGIEVACYLPLLRQSGVKAKLIYDAFNAEAALQQVIYTVDRQTPKRWPMAAYSWLQARRIKGYEKQLSDLCDEVLTVSDEDAALLQAHRPARPLPVVPSGIFADDYAAPCDQLDLGENALVFTGKMDYRPNVDAMQWFSEAILPAVQAKVADVKLYVVGQKPNARIEALRQQTGIEVTGWVREVQPYLQSAKVYVAPLRMGSGTRLKLLEAMAKGCAIVATTIAISGMKPLDALANALIIADSPEAQASAITDLLHNPAKRETLGAAARAFVRRYYDWSALIPSLLHIYQELGLE